MKIDTKFDIGQRVIYNGGKAIEGIEVVIAHIVVRQVYVSADKKGLALLYDVVEVEKKEVLGPCSWSSCFEEELMAIDGVSVETEISRPDSSWLAERHESVEFLDEKSA